MHYKHTYIHIAHVLVHVYVFILFHISPPHKPPQLVAIKIPSKWELRRLCGAVNATALVRLGPPTAEEAGFVDLVEVREVGGRKVTVFEQEGEGSRVASIILRASTHNVLDDLERAVDDGVNTVKVGR